MNESSPPNLSPVLMKQLNTETDLDVLLGRILKLTLEIADADRGSILVLDESGSVKHQILARPGQTPEFATYNVLKVMKDGLGGWVYANRQPALLRDVTQDPRWVVLPQDQWETGSAMAVPFFFQERVSAMIFAQHETKGTFDTPHLERLVRMAEQTANSLEKARIICKATAEKNAYRLLLEQSAQPLLIIDDSNKIVVLSQAALPYFASKPGTSSSIDSLPEGKGLLDAMRLFRSEESPGDKMKIRTTWPGRASLKMAVRELQPLGMVLTFLE
ncbi:MAG: GAF domain-containing protein [Magnetococcus sp. DMHC-1]